MFGNSLYFLKQFLKKFTTMKFTQKRNKKMNEKMKLSIPHNWQNDLIDNLNLTYVEELYGKKETDIIGGGRASNISPPVSKNKLASEIKKAHSQGLKFNYLLNSTCLDNQELSHLMQKKIRKHLDWLVEIGVDRITVSLPYLLKLIKKNYPLFEISISTMSFVDTPDKAKYWEDLGASKITLYEVIVNRDLELLQQIRKAVNCKLQLITNNACLYDCPFTTYHALLSSHASQKNHFLHGFIIDFYRILCTYLRAKDLTNFIRADWIRPEDVALYEKIGIDSLKIVNRGMATPFLKKIVQAYTERKYQGNLLDLIPSPSKNISFNKLNFWYIFKYFFRPHLINIFKLPSLKKIFKDDIIYIDNQKLDGFLLGLQNQKCAERSCKECQYCKEKAEEVIKVDTEALKKNKQELEEILKEFTSGELFKYL